MRISEYVLAAFLAWTTALSLLLPISSAMRNRTLIANGIVFVIYAAILRLRGRLAVHYLRDWLPIALIILAYKEMGWFAPAVHSHRLEREWVTWDRLILRTWHGREIIEFFSPVLPAILEVAYALVYALPPVTMGVLYAHGKRLRADALLTIYLLGLFLSYAQFPFWPSEPPRNVFPNDDLPVSSVFRQFNLWLLGTHGIHTSVFPSAHVSGVFAAALAVRFLIPERRGLVTAYFVYAMLVGVATVYGRYHYAVDVVAGVAVGIMAGWLGASLSKRQPATNGRPAESRQSAAVPYSQMSKIQVQR